MTGRVTLKKPRMGELLIERGLITRTQLDEALQQSRDGGKRLGEVLVEGRLVTEEDIVRALAERAQIPFARLRKGLVDPRIVQVLPREKAELYEALPLFRIHNKLILAVSDPYRVYVVDSIRKLTGCEIQPVASLRDDILQMIGESYGGDEVSIEDFVSNLDEADLQLVSSRQEGHFEDIAEMAGESPTINLVNLIVLKAIKERASDIHIEPERRFFRVRYRIDGVLYEVMKPRIELHPAVVSRLKIMANLDIAERRLPQDGRIQVLAEGRTVDLRFSSLPGVLGEKVVLRVLDKQAKELGLDQLGLAPQTLAQFRSLLHKPHGLVLLTGPTGSGKTTTLYAGLRELNSLEKNIITIEDPVEYQFDIINQNQVREEIGLTFARLLKHTLRQDPDIIMVGEIRDAETAAIAVQAALTGHLVLSTLHTNDAASVLSRLLEMRIQPYLLASALVGVVAQRLLRTLCQQCATEYRPTRAEIESLGVEVDSGLRLKRGRGCEACFDSGYRGRVGIYEPLVVDHELQVLILKNPSIDDIRAFQKRKGNLSLRADGIQKVIKGLTTLEEVTRAVLAD